MLLTIDVGNSNISIGVWDKEDFHGPWRMITGNKKTSDEYGFFIKELVKENHIDPDKLTNAVVSSVVPNIMYSLRRAIEKYLNLSPLIVGPGTKTGIIIKAENPKEVGADRIVDSVAAYEKYKDSVIIINFGTATTYDVVNEKGEFIAGITSPGIQICADALWKRTAQLPNIEIKKPKSILARNTITSMQAGLVYGYIGQVEYIVKKIKEELKMDYIKVVATGGLANIVFGETKYIDDYDMLLTMRGLKLIHEKNLKI